MDDFLICSDCDGMGWTQYTVWLDFGDTEVIKKFCDTCDGTGRLEDGQLE